MKFINFSMATGIITILASAVSAQGIAGTISYDYTNVASTSPDGSITSGFSENYFVQNITLDLDWTTASGYTLGANIMSSSGSENGQLDAFNSGVQSSLSVGRQFGDFYAEAYVGYLDAIGEDNQDNSTSYYGGIAGSYALSSNWTMTGQLGYLDNDGGTDDDGLDAIGDAVFGSIGVSYDINNSISVGLNIAGASGLMDDDDPRDERVSIIDTQAIIHYVPSRYPNWDIYGTASFTSYFQDGENDLLEDTSFGIGVAYHFGAVGPVSAPTLPLSKWTAVTAGVLE